MSFSTKFGVTLLASLVLTACSGGGSKGGNSPANTNASSSNNVTQPSQPPMVSSPEATTPPATNSETTNSETSAQPVPAQPEAEQPKTQPKVDLPKAEQPKTKEEKERELLSRLNIGGNLSGILYLNIDNADVKNSKIALLESVKFEENKTYSETSDKYSFATDPTYREIRDNDGNLIGYSAYGVLNRFQAKYGKYDGSKNFVYFYEQFLDSSQRKQPTATTTMQYEGTMNYSNTENVNNQIIKNLTAKVDATYHGDTKKLSMDIKSKDELGKTWKLYNTPLTNSHGLSQQDAHLVAINEDGSFTGYLGHLDITQGNVKVDTKSKEHAGIEGGFYGQNAEKLLAEVKGLKSINNSNDTQPVWQGVIEATSKTDKR